MRAYSNTDPVTAGFMMSQLCLWKQEQSPNTAQKTTSFAPDSVAAKLADIPTDAIYGGLWLLSEGISIAVDNSGMEGCDMPFSYTYCVAGEQSLWEPVVTKMTLKEWDELCQSHILPDWLTSEVHAVMRKLDLIPATADSQ